jgi:hypothetical protein
MMVDLTSADEINGKNDTAVEGERDISPTDMELLIDLMDAAKTPCYIDWSTFSQKPHT